ncbi:non-ribosomal peptide synthetase, partial [Clostridium cibarium]
MVLKKEGYEELLVDNVDILTEEEKKRILYDFNDTYIECEKNKTIHKIFEKQVEKTPDNIAVIFDDKKLTYRQLNEKANNIARILRKKGISSNNIVAIMVERSLEMVIGVLGILKAGGTYLPIDPEYPEERIKYIINEAKVNMLLIHNKVRNKIQFSGEIINLDDELLYKGDGSNLGNIKSPEDAAYIIYTSGTTGNPKGIITENRNVVTYTNSFIKLYKLTDIDATLQQASFTFDGFVEEIYSVLFVGGRIIVPKNEEVKDAISLRNLIIQYKVTILSCSPLILSQFNNLDPMPSVHTFLSSSDVLKSEYFSNIITYSNVYNMYGPSETTVCATYYKCNSNEKSKVLVGKPINNYKVYILDKDLNVLPIGVAGEVFISGGGVSRGYLNNEKLTKEKFLENPFIEGTRMYRTGDLAKWTQDGNIELLGRIDKQVKIRGYRIELNEVESALLRHELIREVVVIARDDISSSKYLCAYFVADRELTVGEMKQHLMDKLPEYMLPSYYIQLEKIPLTINGKIDQRELPEPYGRINTGTEYRAARTEVEQIISKIWRDILRVDKVGINDNFFELGGDSIKATILITKLNKYVNFKLKLKEIFKLNTIKKISEYISNTKRNVYESIEKTEEKEYYKVSSVQKRMYMLQQHDLKSTVYNVPTAILINGSMYKEKVEEVFNNIVKRHESLRTYFEINNGNIIQKIHDKIEFKVEYIEKVNKTASEIEKTIREFIRPFDLGKAPLFRVGLIKIENEKYILVFDMHHIIADGMSIQIIEEELVKLYKGDTLEDLRIQYKDYSDWQSKFLKSEEMVKQKEYWLNRFSDEIPVLNMPTDFARPIVQSFEGETLKFSIDEDLKEKLNMIANKNSNTMYMVLLAAFNVLLNKYTGQEDIVIGSVVLGRTRDEVSNVVGMFANTLAMRNQPKGEKTFREFLTEVKECVLDAYENQDYQYEDFVTNIVTTRDTSRNPIFDFMFGYQNMTSEEESLKEINGQLIIINNSESKFDMTLEAIEEKNRIQFTIEYSTKLFKKETIEDFIRHFINVIKEITTSVDKKISDIEIISEEEKNKLIYEYNNTYVEYNSNTTLMELFEKQVKNTPNKVAVVFEEKELTYKELNKRANKLARTLRRKGVKPNCLVGVMVERSLEMIVGIIAVLKAGGAYVPIDPHYPEDRIEYIVNDSKMNIFITQNKFMKKVKLNGDILDIEDKSIYEEDDNDLVKVNLPEHLAYIIYTSGSTGKPKGVIITHGSVINTILDINQKFNINEEDKIIGLSSVCFDLSVFDIFGALIVGATLVEIKDQRDANEIIEVLEKHSITVWNSVPAIMYMLIKSVKDEFLNKSLKLVMLSGDWIPLELPNEIKKHFSNAETISLGGATEASIWSIYYPIKEVKDEWVSIPYGMPLANQKYYVLGKQMEVCPYGVTGELYIGGIGLANGYINYIEKTKKAFIMHDEFGMLYRTGDWGRFNRDGYIEFLGRRDEQVKIRGYRIELGDIEDNLKKHPVIRNAVVLQKESKEKGKYIAAYVETDINNFPIIDGKVRYTLPNNMSIAHLNKNETDFMYKEIFEEQNDLKHGISIKDGDCIFDIGANIGLFSLLINNICKNVKVFAFEPIPDLFNLLEINARLYGTDTKVFNCGLSNKNTETVFTFYPKASIMSNKYGNIESDKETFIQTLKSDEETVNEEQENYYSEMLEGRFEAKEIVCKMKTISEIIKENNIDKINLLKIDVEKSEMDVLDGISDRDWDKIEQVVVEVNDSNGRLNTVVNLFEGHGYKVQTDKDSEFENTNIYNVFAIKKQEDISSTVYEEDYYEPRKINILDNQIITKNNLCTFLKEKLPEYMVPNYFVQVEKMPLTANGKIDRKELLKLEENMIISAEYIEPRNEIEERLSVIWNEILGIKNISVKDNFFQIGGHSLKLTMLMTSIHREFEVKISLSELFKVATIEDQAEYIQAASITRYMEIEKVEEREYYPSSSAQKRMYIIQESNKNKTNYNILDTILLVGELDKEKLNETFRKLIIRHKSLRTSFEISDGEVVQKICKDFEFNIENYEVKDESEVEAIISSFIRPFNLSKAPLIRVGLIKIEDSKHILMIDMHHIICDGVSTEIIIDEIGRIYEGEKLEELPIQYVDYAVWQNKNKEDINEKQKEYWLERFSG